MFDLHTEQPLARNEPPTASAKPEMRVLLAAPNGFCAGVRRAIDSVRDTLAVYGAPVYVRRPIVHNLQVVRELEAEGAIFVEELDQVPVGSVVIFSAHGVSPAIAEEAERRGLKAYDAVCPLVAKVHRQVERHGRSGRQLILIGHEGHPEIEGTLGHVAHRRVFVVNSVVDVEALPLARESAVAYAVQTTYSVTDAAAIVDALRERFADIAEPPSSDICYATTNRQAAVRVVASQADSVIIAGEQFSSNATRLAEVASELCRSVQLIASADELDWSLIPADGTVAITAAASTPDSAVKSILEALAERFQIHVEHIGSTTEPIMFKRLAIA